MSRGDFMENIIEIKGLKKFYDEGKVKALNGIDLNIKKVIERT